MNAPLTPDQLAEIRAWLAWDGRCSGGVKIEAMVDDLLAEVERLTNLLGSHADGHRCTCTMTKLAVYHGDNMAPAEWEQDPWCPTHPNMDAINAEVEGLRTRLAQDRCCGHARCPGGSLCCCLAQQEAEVEVDRLRAQVAAVEALTGGPFSDGYRPYAMSIDGEVVLAVGLDDLRAALASGDEVQP